MAAVISRLWRAFFDAGAYREVAAGTTGSCLAHLALAVALVWLPSLSSMTSGFGKFTREATAAFDGMPSVHIEQGEARLDPPGRHEIALEGEPLVVLDAELALDDALAMDQGMILTARQLVIVSKRRSDARVVELTDLGDRVITEADVKGWLAALARFGPVIFYPFAVAFSFAWRLAIAAALGLAALAIARMMRGRLVYEQGFRIATLAGLPTLLVGAVAQASGHADWWPAWLGIACTIAYLTFGVRSGVASSPQPAAL
ncbi:MAG TPA: DUF1189 family protein [Myxococcota bacterium]|nr:DUF1189 family protein [Myxococcota bacterium]